jgi:hypothetical protein
VEVGNKEMQSERVKWNILECKSVRVMHT